MASLRMSIYFAAVLLLAASPGYVNEIGQIGGTIFDDVLEYCKGVAVSPDGRHVYVTSHWRNGALVAFERDPDTGRTSHIQTVHDDEGGVDGLRAATAVEASDDGRFVYVAGKDDNAVSVFGRDVDTGLLAFVEIEKGGITWNGLADCMDLALSPDNQNLYALGAADDTLAVFSVNSLSGELSFVEVWRNGFGGLTDFDYPLFVTVSHDGTQVFVSATTSDAFHIFDRDAVSGALTPSSVLTDVEAGVVDLNPQDAILSPDDRSLYLCSYPGRILVFQREVATGILTLIDVHQNGSWRDPFISGAHSLAMTGDGQKVVVGAEGDETVTVYDRDVNTGLLTRVAGVKDRFGGVKFMRDPQQLAISPDDQYVYCPSALDSVHVFDLHASSGLALVQREFGGTSQTHGLREALHLAVSPDDRNLYVSSMRWEQCLSVFAIDPGLGSLTLIDTEWTLYDCPQYGYGNPTEVIVSPDGANVYVASPGDNTIAVFSRNTDGTLRFLEIHKNNNSGVTGLLDPWSICLAPNGDYLYAAGVSSDSLLVFDRQVSTGRLTYRKTYYNGDFDASGSTRIVHLDGPNKIRTSPDGQNLYVTCEEDDSLVAFTIRDTDGDLLFLEYKADDEGGVNGLDIARACVVSPDGRHLYAGGWGENGLAAFARDADTGALTYLGLQSDGLWSVGRLMAMSSDGSRLYVPYEGSDRIAVYERNMANGQLTLLTALTPETNPGVLNITGAAITADDRFLYASGFDSCVMAFGLRTTATPSATPLPTPSGDMDRDGIPDSLEGAPVAAGQTCRYLADSDLDGASDGEEDSDRSGSRDPGEADARNPDSDGDQWADGVELHALVSDPLDDTDPGALADADADALPDSVDPDPEEVDADGDYFRDWYEAGLADGAPGDGGVWPALGDANVDGAVSNVDALVIQSFFLANIDTNAQVWQGTGFVNTDLNGDASASNLDALIAQSFFLGILEYLPLQ